jgi:hypothetical protein
MKMFSKFFVRPALVIIVWLLSTPLLVACAKPTVNVSVHGVNYSGATFSYYIDDPASPDGGGAGEELEPFAAGGTTCCFGLPKKWRPGIKVKILSTHWLPKQADGRLPSVKNVYVVDVPRYPDGKPGELWVLRATDGSLSVISSDFQPDHPKWPGKVKGWPIPSLEYRRERWELMKAQEEFAVESSSSLLAELNKNPQNHVREAWELAKKYRPMTIKEFSGPDDPRYLVRLKKEYEAELVYSQKALEKLLEGRP